MAAPADPQANMIENISVVIITRDAALFIEKTLNALTRFSDVVIYDNGSQDATVELARNFPNVRVIIGEFLGFGPTKREATQQARNDWVLSLDADEAPTPRLIELLAHWPVDSSPLRVGVILRENYLMGKRITHGGWGGDWLVRLFNRTVYNFDDARVHEKIALDSKVDRVHLQGSIIHRAVTDLSQFLDKINRYSDIHSATSRRHYGPVAILFKSIFAFLRSYVLWGGCLHGWRGLTIAVADANGVFWKYIKTHARRETEQETTDDA